MNTNNPQSVQLTYKRSQNGFSLVELLVATTLGLFLIAGVITSFTSTKNADRMRSAISEMDSNARTAMQILRQYISHAGYPSTTNQHMDKPFFSKMDGEPSNIACGTGTLFDTSNLGAVQPTEDQYTQDQTAKGDILTVVYLADNPCVDGVTSCTGNVNINQNALVYSDCVGGGSLRDARSVACSVDKMPNPQDAKIYSTFYMSSVKHTLYCRGSRGGVQPLIEDIQNIQYLYGVTQDNGTTKYLNATLVENNDWWGLVKSVQIGLLIRSSEKYLLKENGPDKYIVLDKKISIDDSERRRLYRVYTTTINLPNMFKGELK